MNAKLQRLVESGVLIGLATVLSLVKLWQMPLGGSITLCSMLPIMLLAYKYRLKWGLLCGFLYGIVQLMIDLGQISGWGLTAFTLTGSILFDYLIAFTCLGLAGLYGKGRGRFILGMVTAAGARLVSHVISGTIFFGALMPKDWAKPLVDFVWHSSAARQQVLHATNNPLLYSIAYNAMFLVPDFAIALLVGILVYFSLQKFLTAEI